MHEYQSSGTRQHIYKKAAVRSINENGKRTIAGVQLLPDML